MAIYAKINPLNNFVTDVILADQDFIDTRLDKDLWIKSSNSDDHSNPLHHNAASVNMVWDNANQAFYAQRPYASWTLNSEYKWTPPIAKPEVTEEMMEANTSWSWDEDVYQADNTKGWKQIINQDNKP